MASVCEIRSKWNTGSAERSSSCVRTGVGPIHGALDVLLVVVLSACAGAAAVNDPASLTDLPADGAVETLPTDSQPAGESAEFVTFRIEPSASEVRFVIGEILGGAPNTVIGVNDQVSGEILISVSNPAASRIGPIEIGADSFVTDSALRNRAINQFVLQSGIYPLITFTPTAIGGIPGKVSSGTVLTLQIAGKLTIREVTQPVSFEATITVVSESEIRGNAAATISRSDFELTIPSVPRVAGVDEELVLEFDFVALAE
jgi:polyisoprenoid-binding protein YceI